MDISNIFSEIIRKHGFLFIAEVSNNHLGSLERYKKIIHTAKKTGAHAVKIQTYMADSLCLEKGKEKHIIDKGPWAGRSYWDLYKSMEVPREWSLEVRDYANSIGMPILSSPFSPLDANYLMDNGFKMLKVASGEFTYPELIKVIVRRDVKFMASCGFANQQELKWMQEYIARFSKHNNLWCLFNCLSDYPSSIKDLDLHKFSLLKNYCPIVGLSDHSLDYASIVSSYIYGARVFEKHFTLSRADGGPDGFFSLEPAEMAQQIKILHALVDNHSLEKDLNGSNVVYKEHIPEVSFSRSVYVTRDVKAGEIVTLNNIGSFRPSHSESAIHIDNYIGKKFARQMQEGDELMSTDLQD